MSWQNKLKQANVNIHLVATGGGSGFQNELWQEPGSSAYLSGASFPYSPEEQEEFLGFMPEHFCSEEAAVDLASAAYMKAYKFGGKNPVGLAVTASVASEKEHRGDHRIYTCIMTNDKVLTSHTVLEKGVGRIVRLKDGHYADDEALFTLLDGLEIGQVKDMITLYDATKLARERFFQRPFFMAEGKRVEPSVINHLNGNHYTLMPGAFNPPHEGHYGAAMHVDSEHHLRTVFEITSDPPHKDSLSVQDMLKRAKMLQGHNRYISQGIPLYLQKARAFPGVGFVIGADAVVRLMDPKWGVDINTMFREFRDLGAVMYVIGREIDGKFTTRDDIANQIENYDRRVDFLMVSRPVSGEWHISSSEIRKKML